MSFTARFPDELALKTAVTAALPQIVSEVTKAAGPLEANHKRSQLLTSISSILIVGGSTALIVFMADLGDDLHLYLSPFWTMVSIPAGFFALIIGIPLSQKARKLANDFKAVAHETIYTQAFLLLGLVGAARIPQSTQNQSAKFLPAALKPRVAALFVSPEKTQVLALLDHSELVTEERNTVAVDDMIAFTVAEKSVFVAELSISHVTEIGKHSQTKDIFRGYFVTYDLPTTLVGKTFVSTDGDRDGFGHRSFWSAHGTDGAHDTLLEWNQFEKLLHVAATDPAEARYVLSPDFMSMLYDWWKDKKQNIRVSCIGTRLYVLFPSTELPMFTTLKKIEAEAICAEVLSITKPLLHILHLIEVIQVRFRSPLTR